MIFLVFATACGVTRSYAQTPPNKIATGSANAPSSVGIADRFPSRWTTAAMEAQIFAPVTPSVIEAQKRDLLRTLSSLKSFMDANPEWRKFLEYDALIQSIKTSNGSDSIASTNPTILKNWGIAKDSMNLAPMSMASRQLKERNALAQQILRGETAEIRSLRLSRLREFILQFEHQPTVQLRTKILELLEELDSVGQAVELARETRNSLIMPNLIVRLPKSRIVSNETMPVTDRFATSGVYGRMPMHGTGTLTGTRTVRLLPNPNAIELEVTLRGTTRVSSRGSIPEVSVQSTSESSFFAAKRLVLWGWGRWSLGESVATAPTRIRYNAIDPSVRLLGRQRVINEVHASNRDSELQAQRELEESLRERLDQSVLRMTQEIDLSPLHQLRDRLLATEASFIAIDHRSSSKEGEIAIRCYDQAFRNPAETHPPQVNGAEALASIHESLLSLALESRRVRSQLGFKSQSDEQPDDARLDASIAILDDRVKVVFQPPPFIQATIQDDTIRTVFRLKSITDGETTFQDCRVEISWDVSVADGGLKMVRVEKIRVLPIHFDPKTDRLSVRHVTAFRALERSLEQMPIHEKTFELPCASQMNLDEHTSFVHADAGWLQVLNRHSMVQH
jgi:hypothetical protein